MTLPPPDTHCWDEDTSKDVWSHSADQMRAYAEQAVAAERAEIERLREALRNIVGAADMHPVHLEQAIGRARRILGA